MTVKASAFTDMLDFKTNTFTNEKIAYIAVIAKVYFYEHFWPKT